MVVGIAVVLLTVATAAQAATVPGFKSPSGNISCAYVAHPGTLFCTIAQSSYAQTLQNRCMRPDGSGVDWHGFELGATRKGQVTCSGGLLVMGTVRYVTVPYGASWRRGAVTCASRVTGVTCRNRAGHGVFVSRASWRVW
jgi:uncharacterized protein DUF6636